MSRHIAQEIAVAIPCFMNHCTGHLVERVSKYGRFFGCTNYPVCCATKRLREANSLIASRVFGEDGDDGEG
jgi:ssDNA-binding Zn-finger/Zn-ribbon topoisomerase 1